MHERNTHLVLSVSLLNKNHQERLLILANWLGLGATWVKLKNQKLGLSFCILYQNKQVSSKILIVRKAQTEKPSSCSESYKDNNGCTEKQGFLPEYSYSECHCFGGFKPNFKCDLNANRAFIIFILKKILWYTSELVIIVMLPWTVPNRYSTVLKNLITLQLATPKCAYI